MSRKRNLTGPEIDELASRHGVRRVAVENFLISMPRELTWEMQYENLRRDARMYRWNIATRAAIAEGIQRVYGGDGFQSHTVIYRIGNEQQFEWRKSCPYTDWGLVRQIAYDLNLAGFLAVIWDTETLNRDGLPTTYEIPSERFTSP